MVTLLLLSIYTQDLSCLTEMKKVKSYAILLQLFFHPHTALPWSDGLLPLSSFLTQTGDDLGRERRVGEEVWRLPSSDGFLGSILLHLGTLAVANEASNRFSNASRVRVVEGRYTGESRVSCSSQSLYRRVKGRFAQ